MLHIYSLFLPMFTCQSNLTDFSLIKITQFLVWPLSDFAHSKMFSLKSYCYVKIIIANTGLGSHHEIFHIYLVLSFKFTHCVEFDYLQQWNSGEVTDVLAWLCNDFRVMKNVCTENLPFCTRVPHNINKASASAFTVNIHNVSTSGFSTNLQWLWKLTSCLR